MLSQAYPLPDSNSDGDLNCMKSLRHYINQGDEVLIPLEHFNFNNICGQFLGKLVVRFTCTVGEQNMPLRPTVLMMSI